MTRWIAMDETTAQGLRDRHIEAEPANGEVIGEAIAAMPSVLVLPGGESRAIVARIRRGTQRSDFSVHRWTDANAVGYQAGGMLGLLDEPVYEEEHAAPKKKWWQRKGD